METIPLISVIGEFREQDFKVYSNKPIIHCKAFEDNYGSLEMSWLSKI